MAIFINRILDLKRIKAIGFDMDHTIVCYKTEQFERFTYEQIKKKLVERKLYPSDILSLEFDYHRFIHGLIIDKSRGNLLKLNLFSQVKVAYHGTKCLSYHEIQSIYGRKSIDMTDKSILFLDTSFSISFGVLYGQLVDLRDQGVKIPTYADVAVDLKAMLDIAHQDGTLKNEVRHNVDNYIIKDPKIALTLEKLKLYGKKLLLITNSDYHYTNFLLTETITPYLKNHQHWSELFAYTIVNAQKPRFFLEKNYFLNVDPSSGLMSNTELPIPEGIYQGGSAQALQDSLALEGDQILYFGDHIYGDVVSIKKTMSWRTALILDELDHETSSMVKAKTYQEKIDSLMVEKQDIESKIDHLHKEQIEEKKPLNKRLKEQYLTEIKLIDEKITEYIKQYHHFFNPYWGEITRAGNEESRFARQVEKYACIYTTRITDLFEISPRYYFRPQKRLMAHEVR